MRVRAMGTTQSERYGNGMEGAWKSMEEYGMSMEEYGRSGGRHNVSVIYTGVVYIRTCGECRRLSGECGGRGFFLGGAD